MPTLIQLFLMGSTILWSPHESTRESETWTCLIDIQGTQMEIVVTLNGTKGSADIPLQRIKGAKVMSVVRSDKSLSFEIDFGGVTALASVALDEKGDNGIGTFRQFGKELPLKISKTSGPRRPQTPRGPFPYGAKDFEIENPRDGTTLAGTWTFPEGEGPFPAVVLITGSGAQDRNCTLMEHQSFWVLADFLTRRGISVVRMDDRGVGGSKGSIARATTEVFASDILCAVDWLGNQQNIDREKIGLIGHSEGGIVAPIAAADRQEIAFIVLLAAPSITGAETLSVQNRAIFESMGMDSEKVEKICEAHRVVMERILGDESTEDVKEALGTLIKVQTGLDETTTAYDELVTQSYQQMSTPWFRYYLKFDPASALSRVTCPVLALNGLLDQQVLPEQNLDVIKTSLEEALNGDVTIHKLKGLNHLFQTATTGIPQEYGLIEETIAPRVLELIADWIVARTH